jgi:2-methylcitrate dehydratase PrpD
VQCMLLLSRYLQCTNHSHQTWMAVGSAVRAAQSLGLDSSQTSAGDSDARSGQRHRLWQCCVFMDRSVLHPD